MSSWLNRERKRKLRKEASLYEIQERFETAKAQVSCAYLTIPVAVLYREYGWSAEDCNKFNERLLDMYNEVDDYEKFQRDFFFETGIGILEKGE